MLLSPRTLKINKRRNRELLLTYPSLSAPEEGKADETTYAEFPSVALKLHLGTIDLTGFWIQDFSSLIFIALFG
jgi:hypothetical protein